MPNSPLDTVKLQQYLDRFQAGDQSGISDLFRAAGGRLEQLARRMLRNFPTVQPWADSGDVLQNALLRLMRSLQNLRPASTRDFFNLAAVQVRRELIDLARHFAGRQSPHGNDTLAVREPAAGEEDDLETWCLFHSVVERLPAEEREVVSLAFYHGWTQAEIAPLLQIDERTVRRRWHAACLRLREAIGKDFPRK